MGKIKDNKMMFTIIILLVLVLGLSVGFALLSENLTINGIGKVKSSNWNIYFKNIDGPIVKGTAVEITRPEVTMTSIGDYSVELRTPGDSIKYRIDLLNEGDFDSTLSSLTIPTPICTGSGSNAEEDAKNVCDNLSYSLSNVTSDYITEPDTLVESCTLNSEVINCSLPKNIRRTLEVTLEYSDKVTADKLPKSDVTVSNLGISMTFVQD